MKCPLRMTKDEEVSGRHWLVADDCIKEECAWWNSTYEECDPTGFMHDLERIADELAEIKLHLRGGDNVQS